MITYVPSEKIRYLVDEQGRPTDVLIDYEMWQAVLHALEQLDDWATAKSYLERRRKARSPEEMGLEPLPETLNDGDKKNAGLDRS